MSELEYEPSPANANVQKDGEQWTLILARDLRHAPETVWRALTQAKHLHEWAPFDVDTDLDAVGKTVQLTWAGAPGPIEARITQLEPPTTIEYAMGDQNVRWDVRASGAGTRLTLWAVIDRRYISMGAAGWHIALDILARQLDGIATNRIAGGDAMKSAAWQHLNAQYAEQFGVELPAWGS